MFVTVVCMSHAFGKNFLLVVPLLRKLSKPSVIDILLCKYTQVHIAQSFGECSRAIFCKALFLFFFPFSFSRKLLQGPSEAFILSMITVPKFLQCNYINGSIFPLFLTCSQILFAVLFVLPMATD